MNEIAININRDLPKVSIIIPVYNVELYIAECVQSVMRQTYKGEIECIIVDDCGKDRSVEIAEQLVNTYNGPIEFRILHHEHNRGLSAARNTGIDASQGEYIYFLDSDDWIDGNTIEVLYDSIAKSDYAISVGYFTEYKDGEDLIYRRKWIFEKPRIITYDQYADRMLMQESNYAATAKLYNKEKIFNELRFQEGRINEDVLLITDMIPIVEKNEYACIDVPIYSYHYRVNENGICHKSVYQLSMAIVENINIIIDKYPERKEIVTRIVANRLSNCIEIVLDKEADKDSYDFAHKYIKEATITEIKCNRSYRKLINVMLIKYFPSLMWQIKQLNRCKP